MPWPPGSVNRFVTDDVGESPNRVAVDATITPPATTANPQPKIGEIWAGEMLYLTPAGGAASLNVDSPQINTTLTAGVSLGAGVSIPVVSSANMTATVTQVTIDSIVSGVQETVVTTTVPDGTHFTATIAHNHAINAPVVQSKQNLNAASFIGVAESPSYVQVVGPQAGSVGRGAEEAAGSPNSWYIQFRRGGKFRFNTTVADTYVAGQLVYVGADGCTVQKTALGSPIGRVTTDQQSASPAPPGVAPGASITGAVGQEVVVKILPLVSV